MDKNDPKYQNLLKMVLFGARNIYFKQILYKEKLQKAQFCIKISFKTKILPQSPFSTLEIVLLPGGGGHFYITSYKILIPPSPLMKRNIFEVKKIFQKIIFGWDTQRFLYTF